MKNSNQKRDNMHLEILVEEYSVRKVLDNLLPRLITGMHTYRVITYQGKHDMKKKLPKTLKGYSHWINNGMKIIVLLDRDNEDCHKLKKELEQYANSANLKTKSMLNNSINFQILNRIAIEELEAWFLGDPEAIRIAYPNVSFFERKKPYRNPDLVINAWESLERILQKSGYFPSGYRKVEAADEISKFMQPLNNKSKSFQVFWNGVSSCLN